MNAPTSLHLLEPAFLWLLCALPLLWLAPRQQRRRGHGLLRAVTFALVVLALAEPVRVAPGDESTLALVVDESASLAPGAAAGARAEAELVRESRDSSTRVVLRSVGSPLGGSPLGAALESAARSIPEGGRGAIVVWSDGLATEGDWARATQELSARGIPVHVRALAASDPLRPVALRPLSPLRQGHTALLEVELRGNAALPPGEMVEVTVEEGGGAVLARSRVPATARTATLEVEPAAAGFLEVVLRAGGAQLGATLAVDAPLQVLYLGQRMTGGAERLGELIGRGFALHEVEAPEVAALANVDLVVLDDRPAEAVPESLQRALSERVMQEGLGLFASGGRAAFAAGGYHESILAEILPIELLQNQEKRDPSTTLVVIIDTSGSMGGMRVILAKEVARLAMKRLLPHDKVGIVEFYGAKRWAAPIQPASNRIEIERALNRLDAGGGTVILPAIEEAFYGLQNVDTRTKHVLILTDGGVESGAFEPLLRRMADKGINVSTVLVGPEAHSEFLVNVANWGKGRFYSVPNRFNLPEVILKQPASAKLSTYREGEHPLRAQGGERWWPDAVDSDDVRPLAGYVQARQRPGAENLLVTRAGDHPVLASWRYGAGRVTAFLTEPTGDGTAPWSDWDGYGPLLARALTRTADRGRHPFRYDLAWDGPELRITATRLRGDDAVPELTRLPASGTGGGEPIAVRERAPGVFGATLLAPEGDTPEPRRQVRLAARVAGQPDAPARLLVAPAAGAALELTVDPETALDLTRLASATGGRVLPAGFDAAALPTGGPEAAPAATPLRPWIALLALLTYLADIAWRRWRS